MRSKFSIAGHPLHPALVALPIGLFIWSLVAIVVYEARDHEHMWYSIALWSAGAAVVTALLAALPGFGDYFTMAYHSEARGMATVHMLANLTTVALFAISIALMADDGATEGGRLATVIVLQALGVGILGLSGWLGGEMVFRHRLGVLGEAEVSEATQRRRGSFAARPHSR